MENEIKTCFSLYLNLIKGSLKNIREYDISDMTISNIRSQLDVIHMQYIVTSSSYSISESSPSMIAYKHLRNMIDTNDINNKCQKLESDMKMIVMENSLLKEELQELKNKISNTLFTPTNQSVTASQKEPSKEQQKGWFAFN